MDQTLIPHSPLFRMGPKRTISKVTKCEGIQVLPKHIKMDLFSLLSSSYPTIDKSKLNLLTPFETGVKGN